MTTIQADLQALHNPTKAKVLAGFFKTGPGEYGEGDIFLGITVPQQRTVAKKYQDLPFPHIQELLQSPIHEFRFTALIILVNQYEKADNKTKKKIIQFYNKNLKYINNWDLVDTSAPYILGDYYRDKDTSLLYRLARSNNVWKKRVAIISTYGFIRRNQFRDTLALAEILLHDTYDLIQKAVGWMLREVGNRDLKIELEFLNKHAASMPRTTLRYAIEKLDPKTRQHYLMQKKKNA